MVTLTGEKVKSSSIITCSPPTEADKNHHLNVSAPVRLTSYWWRNLSLVAGCTLTQRWPTAAAESRTPYRRARSLAWESIQLKWWSSKCGPNPNYRENRVVLGSYSNLTHDHCLFYLQGGTKPVQSLTWLCCHGAWSVWCSASMDLLLPVCPSWGVTQRSGLEQLMLSGKRLQGLDVCVLMKLTQCTSYNCKCVQWFEQYSTKDFHSKTAIKRMSSTVASRKVGFQFKSWPGPLCVKCLYGFSPGMPHMWLTCWCAFEPLAVHLLLSRLIADALHLWLHVYIYALGLPADLQGAYLLLTLAASSQCALIFLFICFFPPALTAFCPAIGSSVGQVFVSDRLCTFGLSCHHSLGVVFSDWSRSGAFTGVLAVDCSCFILVFMFMLPGV